MAKLILSIVLALGLIAQAQIALGSPPDFPPEIVDAKAVDAFKNYWNAFEAYEQNLLKDGQKQFSAAWADVKRNHLKEQLKITNEQLEALQKSAAKYRQHLAEHIDATNRAYVMLNLAQILTLIGDIQASEDEGGGTFAREEALTLLGDIAAGPKTFAYREQAIYLRATVFEALRREDEALVIWQMLSEQAKTTIYGVHARAQLGDHMFKRDRAGEAMRAYQKALSLLATIDVEDPEYERLRLDYRLAWAAYRAGEVEVVITAASDLLQPTTHSKSEEERLKTQRDAIDLIGDSLYENNVMSKTLAVIGRKEFSAYSAAIGLRTQKRQSTNGVYTSATELGEALVQMTPLSMEMPEILQITADGWDKLSNQDKRRQNLGRLALLLPAQGLWRARNKHDLVAVRSMEERASKAAEAVAAAHYDLGLASGNPAAFSSAASFFEILIDFSANDPAANQWRLRRAHCQFFAGKIDDAALLYEHLKTDFKVDQETLQIASYQLVLTNEKRWREAFAKASEIGEDPYTNPATLKVLAELERSIDEFAARFPAQSRSVDLLLVGASASRDMNRFEVASKYWQRVLVSQPSPVQRSLAVRGMVIASLKTGTSADVVELARRYLKLEDWSALGLTIGNELRGVLSAATLDEGKRLNDSGRVLEAGLLLTMIAEEFPALPDRDRIYRDGSYMLAIAGEWASAEKAAQAYFASGLVPSQADMTYLLARAQEYQLRLHDAAVRYLALGERFPRHSRAATSLKRAERLAVAETDFAVAARAAVALAERAATPAARLSDYARAADYLEKDGNVKRALAVARKAQRSSKQGAERLRAELLVARLAYKNGEEQDALDSLVILSKQVAQQRIKLKAEDYAAIAGEIHTMLGDEARRQFEDFHIPERNGDVSDNVVQKTKFFQSLATEYDKAAAAGDPRWASEARFQLGRSAEALADAIAAVPSRSGEPVNMRAHSRYNAQILRLQALAQRYYSTNVLAARKDPARYSGNDWVKKSSLRLSAETAITPESRHREIMPASVQTTLPSDWSL